MSYPYEILDKDAVNYNFSLETVFVDFLKFRAEYLRSILSKAKDTICIQRELFSIYDALKDGDNLELLSKKMINRDYDFISTQRFDTENNNDPHRNKMNKYFKYYWDSMQVWHNTNEEKIKVFTKVFSEIKYNSASLKISEIDDWDSFAFSYIPQLLLAKDKLTMIRS